MSSKADLSDKFYSGRRKFFFPTNTFIELTLSPKDVQKAQRWLKEDRKIELVWYANGSRVLLVDKAKFKQKEKR
jgi:hypothetical protein